MRLFFPPSMALSILGEGDAAAGFRRAQDCQRAQFFLLILYVYNGFFSKFLRPVPG